MPEQSTATRILRDDVLAQLRTAGRPMSTAELRRNAAKVPVAGVRTLVAPIREQIYRVLCGLHEEGLVTRHTGQGRAVTWAAARGAADDEIAALEAALTPAPAEGQRVHEPNATVCIAAAHLKAAARSATRAISTCTGESAAVTTALSEVVTTWADVLSAVSHHAERGCRDELIAAAMRAADTLTAAPPPNPDWP